LIAKVDKNLLKQILNLGNKSRGFLKS